jgi:hypothetical protein
MAEDRPGFCPGFWWRKGPTFGMVGSINERPES